MKSRTMTGVGRAFLAPKRQPARRQNCRGAKPVRRSQCRCRRSDQPRRRPRVPTVVRQGSASARHGRTAIGTRASSARSRHPPPTALGPGRTAGHRGCSPGPPVARRCRSRFGIVAEIVHLRRRRIGREHHREVQMEVAHRCGERPIRADGGEHAHVVCGQQVEDPVLEVDALQPPLRSRPGQPGVGERHVTPLPDARWAGGSAWWARSTARRNPYRDSGSRYADHQPSWRRGGVDRARPHCLDATDQPCRPGHAAARRGGQPAVCCWAHVPRRRRSGRDGGCRLRGLAGRTPQRRHPRDRAARVDASCC